MSLDAAKLSYVISIASQQTLYVTIIFLSLYAVIFANIMSVRLSNEFVVNSKEIDVSQVTVLCHFTVLRHSVSHTKVLASKCPRQE